MAPCDTAQRSLEHWSEAGRAEMQAFYALATEGYRRLAARDWAADLRARATGGRVRLLDVACGSGKFPAALLAAGLPGAVGDSTGRWRLAKFIPGARPGQIVTCDYNPVIG
jgi:hypothetical protein